MKRILAGAAVAFAGDGDGFSDLLVGAPDYGEGGAAVLFHGSEDLGGVGTD